MLGADACPAGRWANLCQHGPLWCQVCSFSSVVSWLIGDAYYLGVVHCPRTSASYCTSEVPVLSKSSKLWMKFIIEVYLLFTVYRMVFCYVVLLCWIGNFLIALVCKTFFSMKKYRTDFAAYHTVYAGCCKTMIVPAKWQPFFDTGTKITFVMGPL